jgi:sugar lactone lactonase YvrE
VFAPDGRRRQHIALPGAVNFTIAGDVLYITADRAIWAVRLDAQGA